MRRTLLMLAAAAALHCAHKEPVKNAAYCQPEPVCLTTPECTFDSTRGCNVCRCSPALTDTPPGTNPNSSQPQPLYPPR